jgi:hypothetical protein
MARLLALSLITASLASFGGCAMCCAPFDCDYPSVPGRWVRHNPTSGRVGSAFDEAGGPAGVETATYIEGATPAEALPSAGGTPTPAAPPRSVLPRTLGETYLPRGN